MSDVEKIKEKIDITEFIKSRLELHPAGRNFKALCPFHKEKTPSFVVSPERQIWHCFGCGKGGDVLTFLMEYENIEFFEALKILAEHAGIELTRGGGDQKQFTILYDINRAAKDAFHAYLMQDDEIAQKARDYLMKDRGLTKEIIEEFEIGLAPDRTDALSRKLTKAGYNIQDIERAGLIFKTDRGTYWDRFRDRIMFPLLNHLGKPIGFSGRLSPWSTAENVGKYINSPETPVFNKSKLLFGLHASKSMIRDTKTAVLVEGQMDFLMLWQDGIKNTVATSGTPLTREHLRTLRRFAENLTLIFDTDDAGHLAAERTIDLAGEYDMNVRVFNYDLLKEDKLSAKDPADVVQEKPGLMKSLIEKAEPAMEYYFRRYLDSKDTVTNKKKNVRVILAKIKHIASAVEREHWVKKLSLAVGVSESALKEEMESLKLPKQSQQEKANDTELPFQFKVRKEAISYRLLTLAYAYPNFRTSLHSYTDELPESFRGLFLHIHENKELPAEIEGLLNFVVLRSGMHAGDGAESELHAEFSDLLRELRRETLKERREVAKENLRKAEASGDEAFLQEALREFDTLSKEMHNM